MHRHSSLVALTMQLHTAVCERIHISLSVIAGWGALCENCVTVIVFARGRGPPGCKRGHDGQTKGKTGAKQSPNASSEQAVTDTVCAVCVRFRFDIDDFRNLSFVRSRCEPSEPQVGGEK